MKFQVDLNTCQNHGQCCMVAPDVFSLDEESRELIFRTGKYEKDEQNRYTSAELDESLRSDVEDAADMCPTQAIQVLD